MIVSELVTRALRRAALPGIDTVSAADMSDGVDRLNEMLAAWALEAIDLAQPVLTQTDTITINAAYLKPIIDCLAVELAVDHGMAEAIPPAVAVGAERGKDALRVALFTIDDLTIDTALLRSLLFDFTNG